MLSSLIAAVVAVTSHAAAPTGPASLGDVYFEFDSAVLSATAHAKLEKPAHAALVNPGMQLVLDAHTDPIGTATYNVGLSIRRANAVRGALVDMGVPAQQIVLAVYGEDGAPRTTYAADRRVSVWESRQPLDGVIARTFERGGTAVTWGRPLTVAQLALAPESVAISQR